VGVRPNPARGFVFLFLALCAGGVGFLLFGAEYIWVESAHGRVAEVVWGGRPGKRMCSPVFEYEVDGELHRATRDVQESACGWSEGEELTIYYRAHSPGKGYALTFFGLLPGIIGSVTTLILLLASYRGFRGRPFSLKQRLAVVPIVKLAEAPAGEVVGIRGKLTLLSEPETSPMAGRECLAWQLRVTRWVQHTEPVLVRNEYSLKQFTLDDGEQQATAAPGVSVKLLLDADETGRTKDAPSPKLEAFLRSKGFSESKADTTLIDYEWKEGVLPDGGEAVVYAVIEPGDEGYRFRAPKDGAIIVATEDLSKHKPET